MTFDENSRSLKVGAVTKVLRSIWKRFVSKCAGGPWLQEASEHRLAER